MAYGARLLCHMNRFHWGWGWSTICWIWVYLRLIGSGKIPFPLLMGNLKPWCSLLASISLFLLASKEEVGFSLEQKIRNVPSAPTATESLIWWIIRCYISSLFSTSRDRNATTPRELDVTSDVVLSCCCCPSAVAEKRHIKKKKNIT